MKDGGQKVGDLAKTVLFAEYCQRTTSPASLYSSYILGPVLAAGCLQYKTKLKYKLDVELIPSLCELNSNLWATFLVMKLYS